MASLYEMLYRSIRSSKRAAALEEFADELTMALPRGMRARVDIPDKDALIPSNYRISIYCLDPGFRTFRLDVVSLSDKEIVQMDKIIAKEVVSFEISRALWLNQTGIVWG